MNEEQVRELLMLIDANSYSDFKVTSVEATTRVWLMTLQDYPYEQVMFALTEYFKTGGHFAPKPSDLIEIIKSSEDYGDLGEIEASTLVMKALKNSIYNARKEFDKLPPLVQTAVGSARQLEVWAKDEDFNLEVVQSNIQRAYRNVLKQEQNYRRMSPQMQQIADGYRDSKIMIDPPTSNVPMITVAEDNKVVLDGETTSKYLEKLRGTLNGEVN